MSYVQLLSGFLAIQWYLTSVYHDSKLLKRLDFFIWTVMINDPRSGSIHSKSGILKANSAKSQKSAIWGDDLRLGSVNQPQIVDNQFACPVFNFCNDEILIQRLNSTDKQILVKIFVVSAGNYFVNLAKSFILAIFTWRNIWHHQYNGIILCE